VAHDGQAVRAAEFHGLDQVAVRQRGREVFQLAVDPRGDHRTGSGRRVIHKLRQAAGALKCLPGRRAGFHHVLASGEGDLKLVGWHG